MSLSELILKSLAFGDTSMGVRAFFSAYREMRQARAEMGVCGSVNDVMTKKSLNGWGLFWVVSLAMSAVMVANALQTDLSTANGVSHMIGYSVRWAVPFVFLVVAASAVRTLFPGPLTNWWLRNRKYIGLIFAVAMAWQGFFIFLMSNFHRDYYFDEVFLL